MKRTRISRWLLAAMLVVGALRCGRDHGAVLHATWQGAVALERYDFIHAVTFEANGHGDALIGSGQHLIEDAAFAYAIDGDTVTITYDDERRTLRFAVEDGSWSFRRDAPEPVTTRCHRRIEFDASPFPAGVGARVLFSACEEIDRHRPSA